MWHKPCRTFHPWCLCIKTRCLLFLLMHSYNHVICDLVQVFWLQYIQLFLNCADFLDISFIMKLSHNGTCHPGGHYWDYLTYTYPFSQVTVELIVRRAGLLWSQQDFEWRWSVPLFKCLTVLEFSFILFDLCLLITFFNFIMNYVPIVTFWMFTYHKIWILSIMSCFIWSYWIIYFLACLEVSWRVVS